MSLKSSKTWNRRCLCTLPHSPGCSHVLECPLACHTQHTLSPLVLWPPHALLSSVCMQSFKKWMETYQTELAQKENMGIFTKLGQCGLISFSDYMFLLVVLSGELCVCVCWCIMLCVKCLYTRVCVCMCMYVRMCASVLVCIKWYAGPSLCLFLHVPSLQLPSRTSV